MNPPTQEQLDALRAQLAERDTALAAERAAREAADARADLKLTFYEILTTIPAPCGKRETRTTNTKGTLPTYPRSADNFTTWSTFAEEVFNFASTELPQYINVESRITKNVMEAFQGPGDAGCEPDIESSLEITTFKVLKELLRIMGINSSFTRGKGDSSVILDPDYVWKFYSEGNDRGNFRLPIEVKPFFSFPANENLAVKYKKDMIDSGDSKTIRFVNSNQN